MKIGLVLVGAGLVILAGCASPSSGSGGGGSNATRVVKGTVTVADSSYWPYVKIGVFSGSTNGTYPSLTTNSNSVVGDYTLIYFQLGNETAKAVIPMTGISFSSSSSPTSPYSLELPSPVPAAGVYWYLAAWYDTNNDGKLDLIDTTYQDANVTPTEFNRTPTKATKNTNGAATTITIDHFQQSQDANQNYTGQYKYVGFDDNAYNEQNNLDTSNNSNFNFNISATSGW